MSSKSYSGSLDNSSLESSHGLVGAESQLDHGLPNVLFFVTRAEQSWVRVMSIQTNPFIYYSYWDLGPNSIISSMVSISADVKYPQDFIG